MYDVGYKKGIKMLEKDIINFLQSLLRKIIKIELMISQSPPKHIPSYQKLLGLQQKMETLPLEKRGFFFKELIKVRGAITYFLNGRYDDGMNSLIEVKKKVIKLLLKNERNKNKKL